jgi:hypothetical protein
LSPVLLLLLLAPAQEAPAERESWIDFHLAFGGEWDTNAFRAVDDPVGFLPVPDRPVVSDGLARLLVSASGGFTLAEGHRIDLSYVLGAKRFLDRATEDMLVHDLSVSTEHVLAPWLIAIPWATLRANRTRSGVRDYSLGVFGMTATVFPIDILSIAGTGSLTVFEYDPEDRVSYWGPSAGVEATLRPSSRFSLSARVDYAWRAFSGNGLVEAYVPDLRDPTKVWELRNSYCDGIDFPIEPPEELKPEKWFRCSSSQRHDRELSIGLRTRYRLSVAIPALDWTFLADLGAEYLLRIQRSTSLYEDIDRHRISAYATFSLPLDFTANAAGALQFNHGASATAVRYPGDDDENQNTIQVQLSRPLTETLSAELRWAFYTNQFTTAPVSFARHTFYFGLSYRIGT